MTKEYKTLLTGTAENDITPPVGTQLAGYFQRRISDGVIHPLMAKAAVFGEGDNRCCLIVLDIITMTAAVRDKTREIIAAETGIKPERIMISATHTHTGPESETETGTQASMKNTGKVSQDESPTRQSRPPNP